MSNDNKSIGNVAPLENVSRLLTLISQVAGRAHGLPGLACFHGRAGHGKTSAATYAVNKLNACHIEAPTLGGARKLLEMIVRELGLRPQATASRLFDQAAEELGRTGRPLIIDEADLILKDTQIETIRKLQDLTQVAVILMGEDRLPHKLMAWPRVHGRVMAWAEASPMTANDLAQLARVWARGVEIAEDLRARVEKAAGGSHRYAATNLAAIRAFAEVRGLSRITLADWGDRPMHTGEPPAFVRVQTPLEAARQRRGAA